MKLPGFVLVLYVYCFKDSEAQACVQKGYQKKALKIDELVQPLKQRVMSIETMLTLSLSTASGASSPTKTLSSLSVQDSQVSRLASQLESVKMHTKLASEDACPVKALDVLEACPCCRPEKSLPLPTPARSLSSMPAVSDPKVTNERLLEGKRKNSDKRHGILDCITSCNQRHGTKMDIVCGHMCCKLRHLKLWPVLCRQRRQLRFLYLRSM